MCKLYGTTSNENLENSEYNEIIVISAQPQMMSTSQPVISPPQPGAAAPQPNVSAPQPDVEKQPIPDSPPPEYRTAKSVPQQ